MKDFKNCLCSSEGKQKKEVRANAGDRSQPKLKVILGSELIAVKFSFCSLTYFWVVGRHQEEKFQ